MKNIIAITLTLSAIVLLLTLNVAFAGDRVKVYELAESGVKIEFPMNVKDINIEAKENSRLAALNETNSNNPRKRFKVFEMGESGQTVSFPLTAEEITAEDAKDAGLANLQRVNSSRPKNRVIVFELAESGQAIEFQVESTDMVMACDDLSTERNC